jgi:hypothetical protein
VHVTFLTPFGALLALGALVPVTVAALRARTMARVRHDLGLPRPSVSSSLGPVLALAAIPVLLAVAATQPVVETTRTLPQRTDAQAFLVMDISRSMLASARLGAPTRFVRAQQIAEKVAADLPELPIGLAGITDRVLPYLFPTTDRRVLDATLEETVGIEQPPPGSFYLTEATSLGALSEVAELNYFPPSAKKRVIVVFTDGETNAVSPSAAAAFRKRPRVATVFGHIGNAGEHIFNGKVPEAGYRARRDSAAALAHVASLTGGKVFSEDQADGIAGAVRSAIGRGPTVALRHEGGRSPLMPWIAALAFLPLAVVFLRRNVSLRLRPRMWRSRRARRGSPGRAGAHERGIRDG